MKRVPLVPAVNVVIVFLSAILLFAGGAWAKPTTPEQARGVVLNWLGLEAAPMGAPLGGQIKEVQTFTDASGNPAYYVVYLNPSGLVFLPADDLVEPIIGFVSGATSYDPSSRLGALVNGDIPARVFQARQMATQIAETATPLAPSSPQAAAQGKWALLGASGPNSPTSSTSSAVTNAAGAPVITNISPVQSGPGNFTVTLTGSNFTGVTSVTCFPINITWTVDSDTQITIHGNFPVGSYWFTVTGPNGSATSPTLQVGIAPAIYYVSPSLHAPGNFTVTLTGINFTPDLMFICSDATLALTWTVISNTQITITGNFPTGTYTFTVQNAFGAATSPTLTVGQFGLSSPSDVRVAPFIQTNWGRTTVDGYQTIPPFPNSLPCYNYFTPPYPAGSDYNYLNYPTGTIATAQLMRFWQYPTAGVGTTLYTITVNGGASDWPLRGGDGLGGPYDWGNMLLDPSNPIATDLQRQAIGNLCHDIDLSVNMDYEWTYNGTSYTGTDKYQMSDVAKALVATFKYGNARDGSNAGNNIPYTNRDAMINPNLHAGYPVVLGITSTSGGDFLDLICDGYGYNLNSIYHHLHLDFGYGAWFNLPLVYLSTTDNKLQFNILTDIIYNVYPSGSGEIIAGRVLDSKGGPLQGATVTATRTGGGVYSAITNANGIYAIVKVPSSSTYSVVPSFPGLTYAHRSASTGSSTNDTINTGNVWPLDFTPGGLPTNPLNRALDNYSLTFSTSGDADWFEESNYKYYGPSAAQSGAISSGQNSSMETYLVGPGTLSFYWAASSYLFYNRLYVYLDNVQQDSISGVVDWTQKNLSIPAGTHTVRWTYNKTSDATSPFYSDAVWVDKVVYTPNSGSKSLGGIYQLLLMN